MNKKQFLLALSFFGTNLLADEVTREPDDIFDFLWASNLNDYHSGQITLKSEVNQALQQRLLSGDVKKWNYVVHQFEEFVSAGLLKIDIFKQCADNYFLQRIIWHFLSLITVRPKYLTKLYFEKVSKAELTSDAIDLILYFSDMGKSRYTLTIDNGPCLERQPDLQGLKALVTSFVADENVAQQLPQTIRDEAAKRFGSAVQQAKEEVRAFKYVNLDTGEITEKVEYKVHPARSSSWDSKENKWVETVTSPGEPIMILVAELEVATIQDFFDWAVKVILDFYAQELKERERLGLVPA